MLRFDWLDVSESSYARSTICCQEDLLLQQVLQSIPFSRLTAHCLLEQPGMFQQMIDVVWKWHQRHSALKSTVFCCRFQPGLPSIWANIHKDHGQNPCDHLQILAPGANNLFRDWSTTERQHQVPFGARNSELDEESICV